MNYIIHKSTQTFKERNNLELSDANRIAPEGSHPWISSKIQIGLKIALFTSGSELWILSIPFEEENSMYYVHVQKQHPPTKRESG